MKVIITGVTGQDGSYMAEYLLKNTDHEIVACVRRTSKFIDRNVNHLLQNKRFKIVNFDLLDPHVVSSTIKREQPDYFINFAAQTFVKDSWDSPVLHFNTNAVGVLNILEIIRHHAPSCRFYSSGSSEEFGDVEYCPQDEKHPLRPRSPYGASKAAARHIVKVYRESYGLYAIQGFLFNHESPRRQDYFVTRKISKGAARINAAIARRVAFEPIELGNLDAKRDWSDARDFVDGVWRMLNQETYNEKLKSLSGDKLINNLKEYVLSSNETHTVREFAEACFDILGIHGYWDGEGVNERYVIANYINGIGDVKSEILVKVNPEFYRPAEVNVLLGDSSLARRELKWEPKSDFKKLVKDMVENDLRENRAL